MGARLSLLVAALLVVASFGSEPAYAATCGETDPTTNKRVKGTLTLDSKSVTNLSFKRSTEPAQLSLIFAVSGCEIEKGNVARPRIAVLPAADRKQFPPGGRPTLNNAETLDGSDLIVLLDVDPKLFDAGTYGGHVNVIGSYLTANSTPVTASRSEDDFWKPIAIGLVCALVGFVWFAALKLLSRAKLEVRWPWLIPVAVLAVGAGAVAAFISYWDQEVWTFETNAKATATTAFFGASTGAAAGLLATVWRAPAATPTPPTPAPPASTPTPSPTPRSNPSDPTPPPPN